MKISVCMATYNGEKYIKEQLSSILPLLNDGDELIISDNGSTDRTIEIIKQYADKHLILENYHDSKSPVFNFENALIHASGDVIVLSDQDDRWDENKLIVIREQFEGMEKKTVLKMFNGNCINTEGKVINNNLFQFLSVKDGLCRNIVKNSFMGCNLAFSKSLLDYALPFPEKIPMHDSWLAVCAYLFGEAHFIDQKVFSYRIHSNNFTGGSRSVYQKIKWRFFFINMKFTRRLRLL